MSKNPVLYKFLAVGVIVLFIGVAVQPAFAKVSINSDNSELEEVTIQFFETDRTYNHTVWLTQEQIKDLEQILDNLKIQLELVDNQFQTETIYKNAVLSFDKFGLLPDDMSIDYAQRLLTGKEQDSKIIRILERVFDKHKGLTDSIGNYLCLISGSSSETYFMGPFGRSLFVFEGFINNLNQNWYYLFQFLFQFLYGLIFIPLMILFVPFIFLEFFWNFNPLPFGYEIGFGTKNYFSPNGPTSHPAGGWYHTKGLSGTKNWEGKFFGDLPIRKFAIIPFFECYPGVLGFTGLRVKNFIMGFALWVKIRNV